MADIKTLDQSIRERYEAGKITLREAAIALCKAGWDNFIDEEKTAKRLGVWQ